MKAPSKCPNLPKDYRNTKYEDLYEDLFPSHLCASNPPKSGCEGDSGGPFICNEDGKAIVHGVVSGFFAFTNRSCGKVPSLLTNVSLHMPFIECILAGKDESTCQWIQGKADNMKVNLFFFWGTLIHIFISY